MIRLIGLFIGFTSCNPVFATVMDCTKLLDGNITFRKDEAASHDRFLRILNDPSTDIDAVDVQNRSALLLAAGRISIPPYILKDIIDRGASPRIRDEMGYNALMRAVSPYIGSISDATAFDGRVIEAEILRKIDLLLKHFPEMINERNLAGETALMLSLELGSGAIFKKLLHHPGVNLQIPAKNGDTVLIRAVKSWRADHVRDVIARLGPEAVNAQNALGRTALMESILDGSDGRNTIEALLTSPYHDIKLKDRWGRSAVDYAKQSNFRRRKTYLLKSGILSLIVNPSLYYRPSAPEDRGFSLPRLREYADLVRR